MKLVGPINHWRADPSGWIGSVIMLGFAGIAAWRWHGSGLLFYALTFLRDFAAAWFLLVRKKDVARLTFGCGDILAYMSSALPLFYLGTRAGTSATALLFSDVLVTIGFVIATIALFELGETFGVSPANRGRVGSGIYAIYRHPMYLGYILAEVGLCFLDPRNVVILVLSAALYLVRTLLEDRTLNYAPVMFKDVR